MKRQTILLSQYNYLIFTSHSSSQMIVRSCLKIMKHHQTLSMIIRQVYEIILFLSLLTMVSIMHQWIPAARFFEAHFTFSESRSSQWVLNDIGNRSKPMIKTFNHQNTAIIVVMWKPPIEWIKYSLLQNATIYICSHYLLWSYGFLDESTY